MSSRKTILLVEDQVIIALAESRTLEKAGYHVISVITGDEALEAVRATTEIDLILMDIDLGDGIDGIEVAENILLDHDIPIVFLSAHTDAETVEKTERITSYGYIVKNSGKTVFLASIKMAFKLFDSNRRVQKKNDELQSTIAALNRANEDLRTANEKLEWWDGMMKYVIEHNPSGVVVLDRNLRHIYVSDRFLEDFQVRYQDVIHKNHYEVFPGIPQRIRDVHQRVLAGEEIESDHDRLVRRDGTVEHLQWWCRPWYASDDQVGGIIIYAKVITTQKLVEEKFRRSEELLNQVEKLCDAGGWEWDIPTDTVYTTSGLNRFCQDDLNPNGSSPREFLEVFLSRFKSTDGTAIRDGARRCRIDGFPFFRECSFTLNGGERRWVRVSMNAVRNGELVEKVVGCILDVSPLKEIKEELQVFLDHSPLLISEFTTDGRYKRVNSAFANGMHQTPAEVVGKSFSDFLPPDKIETFRERIRVVLESRTPLEVEDELTFDGDTSYFESTLFPLFNQAGEIQSIGIIARDVSESVRAKNRIYEQD